MEISKTWTELKALTASKSLALQYEHMVDTPERYFVWAVEGPIVYKCIITDSAEMTDFADNYADDANGVPTVHTVLDAESRDDNGNLKIAQTFPSLGMVQIRKGYKFTATAGQTTFYDIEVTTQLRISGGKAWFTNASDVHDDDYVEFSIVDKNDVLGLFSTYGLTVGEDVLELAKFVRTSYVKKGDVVAGHPMCFEPSSIHGDPITQGLFMRAAYDSNGTTDIGMIFDLTFYEG